MPDLQLWVANEFALVIVTHIIPVLSCLVIWNLMLVPAQWSTTKSTCWPVSCLTMRVGWTVVSPCRQVCWCDIGATLVAHHSSSLARSRTGAVYSNSTDKPLVVVYTGKPVNIPYYLDLGGSVRMFSFHFVVHVLIILKNIVDWKRSNGIHVQCWLY